MGFGVFLCYVVVTILSWWRIFVESVDFWLNYEEIVVACENGFCFKM